MSNILKAFCKTSQYSIPLAKLYGVQISTLLTYIAANYWTEPFNPIVINLAEKGLTNDTIQIATKLGLITILSPDSYVMNITKLEEDIEKISGIKVVKTKLFPDPEFQTLLKQWNEGVVKARIGKPRSLAELEALFLNRDLGDALKALRFAVDNKFVTLNFDPDGYTKQRSESATDTREPYAKPQGDNQTPGNAGGIGNRSGDTKDTPTAAISKRAFRLG